MYLIDGSVPTGFEKNAAGEVKEKLGVDVKKIDRGHVFFEIHRTNQLSEVLALRSFDNLYVVIFQEDNINFHKEEQDQKDDKSTKVQWFCQSLVSQCCWTENLKIWQLAHDKVIDLIKVQSRLNSLQDKLSSNNSCGDPPLKINKIDVVTDSESSSECITPKFRVTCNRTGSGHKFSSMEAASAFGGAINDIFDWPVKLTDFDIEIVLNIQESSVHVTIPLTSTSLYKRNIVSFGPTTLRATICYGLLRAAELQPGDIVCDPMCGSAAIPIEGAIGFPSCFFIGSDNHELAIPRGVENVTSVNSKRINKIHAEIIGADVTHFPIRDASIDVAVSDLPFGKRMGSKQDNKTLYPSLLAELTRVVKPGGRAVLLTKDKRNMDNAIKSKNSGWKISQLKLINVGGLYVTLFQLRRTSD